LLHLNQGSAVAIEFRRKGYDVYALIRTPEKGKKLIENEVKVIIGDVHKLETYEEIALKADIIINTSGNTGEHDKQFAKNVDALLKKSNEAGNKKKLVIFTSGGLVYQPNANSGITEESPLSTIPHFQDRISVEKHIIGLKEAHGVVIRPPFVYGGAGGHFSIWFKQAEEGKLVVYGNGKNIIANIHVEDLAEAFVRVVETDISLVTGQIFHVADDIVRSQLEIATAFGKAAGYNKEVTYEPYPNPVYDITLYYDSSKAKRVLGWKPFRPDIIKEAEVLYLAWKTGNYPSIF